MAAANLLSSVKIYRILHAGYIFEAGRSRILFDPIFENPFSINCQAFPPVKFDTGQIENQDFTALFISHFHEDHCSFESLRYLKPETPLYMYCVNPEMFELLKVLGFKNVHSVNLGDPIRVGEFKITAHRALDEEVDCLYEIQHEDFRILNVVDSWIDAEIEDQLAQKNWDLILWPFQTMRELEVLSPGPALLKEPQIPTEWRHQLIRLNPRFLVPSSCQFKMEDGSWYNNFFFPVSYDFFESTLKQLLPLTAIKRLDPGQGFRLLYSLGEKSISDLPPLSWIQNLLCQHLDYDFDPNAEIPLMSEVAARFPALTSGQWQRVQDFLDVEIFKRFSQLDPDLYPFFYRRRTWSLKVFLNLEDMCYWNFTVHNGELQKLFMEKDDAYDWGTEVSAYKLYQALEHGESLTSLYPRIQPLDKNIELSDLLQDPLLRCLYEGQFASYQKAQLRRILGARL